MIVKHPTSYTLSMIKYKMFHVESLYSIRSYDNIKKKTKEM